MNYDRPELLDRLAAEYVLGTLRGPARRRFDQLCTHCRRRGTPSRPGKPNSTGSAASCPPLRRRARVWDAIVERTGARPGAPSTLRRWSWLKPALGFALGTVLTLGVVQLMPDLFVSLDELAQREQALPQSYVGLLTDTNNVPHLLVSSTRRGTRATVKSLRPWQVPAGKVAQVWALPRAADGSDLPRSPRRRPTGKAARQHTLRAAGKLRAIAVERAAPGSVVRGARPSPARPRAVHLFRLLREALVAQRRVSSRRAASDFAPAS